jgi:hypothetical protein
MCEANYDGDTCPVWSEDKRKARKDYFCDGCGGPIRKGDLYLAHRSMYDGYWSAARMCLPCLGVRDAFGEAHRGAVIPHPGSLRQTLEECIDYGDEESDAKWTPMLAAMEQRRKGAAANG